jgi:5-methylcytosine-specific restriction endonuclease McrA
MKYKTDDPCIVCGQSPSDIDHIKTRGSGGGDNPNNLLTVCRVHHSERHSLGLRRFVEKHSQVRRELIAKGWKFDPVLLRWVFDGILK